MPAPLLPKPGSRGLDMTLRLSIHLSRRRISTHVTRGAVRAQVHELRGCGSPKSFPAIFFPQSFLVKACSAEFRGGTFEVKVLLFATELVFRIKTTLSPEPSTGFAAACTLRTLVALFSASSYARESPATPRTMSKGPSGDLIPVVSSLPLACHQRPA